MWASQRRPNYWGCFLFFERGLSTLTLLPLPPFTPGSLELQHRLQQQPEAALYDVVGILGEAAAAYRNSRENILGISSWCDHQFAPPLVGGGQGGEGGGKRGEEGEVGREEWGGGKGGGRMRYWEAMTQLSESRSALLYASRLNV